MTHSDTQDPEKTGDNSPLLEVQRRARKVANTLGMCDTPLAKSLVESLNKDAVTMGLTGRNAVVRSDMISWQRETFDFANERTLMTAIEDMPNEGSFEVMMTGFDRIKAQEKEVLLYRFELTSAEPTGSYIVGFAPYHETEVDFLPTKGERKMSNNKEWQAFTETTLKRLFDIESKGFQEELEAFLIDYDATRKITDETLSDLGTSVMNLMAHKEASGDEDARHLILGMLFRLLTHGKRYYFGGSFAEANKEKDQPIEASSNAGTYYVKAVIFMPDYDIEPVTERVIQGEAWQPAFELVGDRGETYFVPLRYIQEFKLLKSGSNHQEFNQKVMKWLKKKKIVIPEHVND